jgi:hypothetical protein
MVPNGRSLSRRGREVHHVYPMGGRSDPVAAFRTLGSEMSGVPKRSRNIQVLFGGIVLLADGDEGWLMEGAIGYLEHTLR